MSLLFFFQAEDGIRYLVRSRGLGDVYKRQAGSTDESAATPVVAGAGPAWSDEAAEPPSDEPEPEPDVTMVHDPFVGWFELPAEFRLPLIDPCAGVEPASEVPEGCPEGTGATVLAVGAPPDPYAFFGVGHHLVTSLPGNEVCPAGTPPAGDGQAAMTLFSRTPVTSAVFRVRPHGRTAPCVDLPLPLARSDSPARTWWQTFAAGEYRVDGQWRPLQPGMTLTVEPGCYIRAADDVPPALRNIGVRIEDNALVTAEGCEILTAAVPNTCLLYTSPSPRDRTRSRMPSSACKKKQ